MIDVGIGPEIRGVVPNPARAPNQIQVGYVWVCVTFSGIRSYAAASVALPLLVFHLFSAKQDS